MTVVSNLLYFLVGLWAASVSYQVKSLYSETKLHKTRVVKADGELRSAQDLVQVMSDLSDAIISEWDMLREDLKKTQARVTRRTQHLKASKKVLRKEKKKLELSEECFFMTTYEMMERRVADVSLDNKLILLDGLEDPVDKEVVPEEPLVVSFDPDEDVSD